ncbi:hypothetical protein KJ586_02715 [Patescibacteria group bacterium]|nr:hypothetical protein [Patescibacteria group bacterium]
MENENNINENNGDKKRKIIKILIIIFALILIIAIIAVIYILFFRHGGPVIDKIKEQEASDTQLPGAGEAAGGKAVIKSKIKEDKIDETALMRMAAAFAERFGSFSNQANYGNISDLKIFMSAKMRAWADDFVAREKAKKAETVVYSGITTKALYQEVKEFDEPAGLAEISVKTQRREMTGDTEAAAFYQDIVIKFVKEKGEWKVDSAEWQGR